MYSTKLDSLICFNSYRMAPYSIEAGDVVAPELWV